VAREDTAAEKDFGDSGTQAFLGVFARESNHNYEKRERE